MVPYARLDHFSQVHGIRKNWNLGAYIHVLVVSVAQTCETYAWVSYATHKKITNVKNGQWQRQHVDRFLITVPHDSHDSR